jgi:hypothetical protein
VPEDKITRQEFASLCSNQYLYRKPETRSIAIPMAVSGRIKDCVKSGPRRLEDAEELMQQPTYASQRSDADMRHLRTAMYLAGYAVECLLKAYLIQQENCQSLEAAQEKINERRSRQSKEAVRDIAHTAAGHSIYYILQLTDLQHRPGYEQSLWGRLAQWQSSWRYAYDFPRRQEAEESVQDVRDAVNWLRPKIEQE